MAKRTKSSGGRPPRPSEPTRPDWPTQGHSGEGSASALAILQHIERKRLDGKPVEGKSDDPAR